jgi:4-amino-4-deoxy-L-arabinose transferase-like glycosyltransferase
VPGTVLFFCVAIASAALAIEISVANLSNIPDEGVYWQSLRAMSAGYLLYEQIFYSQPPLFLMSIYPFYEVLGSTITSARVGVAALSLLGLVGAYLIGNALAGRVAATAAAIVLMVTPLIFYAQKDQPLDYSFLQWEPHSCGGRIQSGEKEWDLPCCAQLRWRLAFS